MGRTKRDKKREENKYTYIGDVFEKERARHESRSEIDRSRCGDCALNHIRVLESQVRREYATVAAAERDHGVLAVGQVVVFLELLQ